MLASLLQGYLLALNLVLLTLTLAGCDLLSAQRLKLDNSQQGATGYPHALYMHFFLACSLESSCAQIESFRVDSLPNGCCVLLLTNGDGQGKDEVTSYEIFLNGDKIIYSDRSRSAQAIVKVLPSNTLKVVLNGEPKSKVFILIAYDPRKPK